MISCKILFQKIKLTRVTFHRQHKGSTIHAMKEVSTTFAILMPRFRANYALLGQNLLKDIIF